MLDTPRGAAFEAGRLTVRLRAFAGLTPLLHDVGVLGEPGIGGGDFGASPSMADLHVPSGLRVPHLWLRRCCEAALDGDRLVEVTRALERLEREDFLSVPEELHEEWDEAFYPLDEEELFWTRRGFIPPAAGEAPPAVDPEWSREWESRDALLPLIRRHAEPAVAFAQDVRRAFATGPADVAAAHELGRTLAEVELPATAYRVVLEASPGWRWPLDRGQLEKLAAEDAAIRDAVPVPESDLPDRLAAAVAAEAGEYPGRVRRYRERRARWHRRYEKIRVGKRARHDPFRDVFVPVPGLRFVGPGPWELRPEPSLLLAVPALASDAGLPAGDLPAPPVLPAAPRPDAGGWLDRNAAGSLATFGRRADEFIRHSLRPAISSAPAMIDGPCGITFDPNSGVARRGGKTVTLAGRDKKLFQALCEYPGRISSTLIDRNPPKFGFQGKREEKAGDDAAKSTAGWKATKEGQRRNAASGLSGKIAEIGLSASHRQDCTVGYIELHCDRPAGSVNSGNKSHEDRDGS